MRSLATILYAAGLVFCLQARVHSQQLSPPESVREEANRIMKLITAFDFAGTDEALRNFEAAGAGVETSLYGSFLRAYRDFLKFLLSPYDSGLQERFKISVDSALAAAGAGEKTGIPDAALFKSCAYLLLSLYENELGNGISSSVSLIRGTMIAREIGGSFPNGDPYLIVGCYDFYLSRGKSDYRQTLDKTIENGFFFRDLARFMAGRLLQKQDTDWESSTELFSALVRDYPENPLFGFSRAKGLEHTGRYRESIAAYDRTLMAVKFRPKPVELLCRIFFSKGQIFETRLKELPPALASYTQAFETADRGVKRSVWFIPWSLLHIGYCNERMGNIEEAIASFSAVSKEDDREAWKRAQEAIARIHAVRENP